LSLRQDPVEFFKLHGSPLILDEVQRAPECFSVLKYMIDSDRRAGMYILTGSQKYALMKGVSESLAGRIGIIDMLGLSDREIYEDPFDRPFLPTSDYLLERRPKMAISFSRIVAYHIISEADIISAHTVPSAAPSTPRPMPGIAMSIPQSSRLRVGKMKKKLNTTSSTHMSTFTPPATFMFAGGAEHSASQIVECQQRKRSHEDGEIHRPRMAVARDTGY